MYIEPGQVFESCRKSIHSVGFESVTVGAELEIGNVKPQSCQAWFSVAPELR